MPTEELLQFKNCRLLRQHSIVKDDLWVRDGKIVNPEKVFFDEKISSDVTVDCQNLIIAPGFIDVQINGACGIDFSLETDDIAVNIQKVAKLLLSHGVTSFCPTLVTSASKVYKKILPKIKRQHGSASGAEILGVHLEGPFISREKKGAHAEEFIQDSIEGVDALLQVYGTLDNVSIVTLASELPGAVDVISQLTDMGIVTSLGHSVAGLTQGEAATRAGASFITHLFNAMLPFHHRDPHLVGLLTSCKIPSGKTMFYGMISDGIHTHPASLRIAHRTHPAGIVLVTDAISPMGLPEGVHHLGSQTIEIRNNAAYVAGTSTLCGSIATMDQCVSHFFHATGCTQVEALESASLHPAELLNITHRKGSLHYGTDADVILLDDDLNVMATVIAGKFVWNRPGMAFRQERRT